MEVFKWDVKKHQAPSHFQCRYMILAGYWRTIRRWEISFFSLSGGMISSISWSPTFFLCQFSGMATLVCLNDLLYHLKWFLFCFYIFFLMPFVFYILLSISSLLKCARQIYLPWLLLYHSSTLIKREISWKLSIELPWNSLWHSLSSEAGSSWLCLFHNF